MVAGVGNHDVASTVYYTSNMAPVLVVPSSNISKEEHFTAEIALSIEIFFAMSKVRQEEQGFTLVIVKLSFLSCGYNSFEPNYCFFPSIESL